MFKMKNIGMLYNWPHFNITKNNYSYRFMSWRRL